MKRPTKDSPNQLTFSVVLPPTIQATGDGYKVIPGKPVLRLTPAQFASQFNVDRDTVYRWIDDGTVDPQFVIAAGKRKLLIASQAVADCQTKFQAHRL